MIKMIGAAMPIDAYVGSRPIATVAPPIMSSVKTSIFLRPIRSPKRPATMAPSGRKRKLMPMVASEMIRAKPSEPSVAGAMNKGAKTSEAAWA